MNNTLTELTFEGLTRVEPRLKILEGKARHLWLSHRMTAFEVEHTWYTVIKPAMCRLVGFGAASPELRNSQAYDICYKALFNVLSTGRAGK